MVESLNYIDLPGLGAMNGVRQYGRESSHGPLNEFDCAYVYGRDEAGLTEQVGKRRARVDFARDFEGEWAHPDGFPMAKREAIIHVIRKGSLTPMRIVGVEIYPPFDDPQAQEQELERLRASISAAHDRDLDRIKERLSLLGMSELL